MERLPAELTDLDRIASVPATSATDIGGALRLASALFPDDTQKRIVLVSDGNDTTGRGQSEAALAAARGVQIETYEIGLGAADETIVQRVHSPTTARVGEDIQIEVTISSTVAQPATVRLFGDGAQIGVQHGPPELAGPEQRDLHDRAPPRPASTRSARASRPSTTPSPRTTSATRTRSSRAIRGSCSSPAARRRAATCARALTAEHQDVTDGHARAGAHRADRLRLLRLGRAGRRRGVAAGHGPDAGPAGLHPRPRPRPGHDRRPQLVRRRRLQADARSRKRCRSTWMFATATASPTSRWSWSSTNRAPWTPATATPSNRDNGVQIQGVPKVDIGKEAILRAVSALTERDEFGVVAFNENAHWVIRTAPLGSVGDVEEQIAGIQPDGQTNIFAGLSEAVASLEQTSRHAAPHRAVHRRLVVQRRVRRPDPAHAGRRHHALDGRRRRRRRRRLPGRAGRGRAAAATTPRPTRPSIPDIFLKETQQVSGQQIVEEDFFPVQTSSSPILRGLEEGLPQLLGYNGTTAKAAAQTVLVTSRDDPLLAQWQYGLGRRVAWTSDAPGPLGSQLGRLGRLQQVLLAARLVDVPGRGVGRHGGRVHHRGRRHQAAAALGRVRRHAAQLLRHGGGRHGSRSRRSTKCASTRSRRASTRPTRVSSRPAPMPCASCRPSRARRRWRGR